jgi:hypothetical protein
MATGLRMRVLDGAANDDFMVFIKNKNGHLENIYTYISDPNTTEVWKVLSIPLSSRYWFDKSMDVVVMSTGSDWSSKSTYGQVGIDWMELVGLGGPSNPPICHDCDDND